MRKRKLTERQLEVYNLRQQGLSYRQIGNKLGIKSSTVYTVIKTVADKLDLQLTRKCPPKAYDDSQIHEVTAVYTSWSRSGIMCDALKECCELCPIWQNYGRRHGQGCYQPEANQILRNRRIKPYLSVEGEALLK